MKNQPKLIFLHGFAAWGKTTLAERYMRDHPLALAIEGDIEDTYQQLLEIIS